MLSRSTNCLSALNYKSICSFTMKSKRQFTPNLFQNPKLTPHGLITRIPKSYDYKLPQDLPNRHLYWDRSKQNKLRRTQYNSKKLQKLRIKPIHVQGKRTFNRSVDQILGQIANLRLVRASLNRTFANLSQVLIRFGKTMSPEDMQIVTNTIHDIHTRFLASLSPYHFSTYCQLRCLANLDCTQQIFIHYYKYVQQHSQASISSEVVKKFPLKIFLQLTKYVFRNKKAAYIQKNEFMLYKSKEMFKLFEDNDPRFISFEELVPNVYTHQEVQEQLKDQWVGKNVGLLRNLPAGNLLLQNIGIKL